MAFEGTGDKTTRIMKYPRPKNFTDGLNITKTGVMPFDIQKITKTKDIAGLTFNPVTGRLIVLGEVNRRVYDLGLNGEFYGKHILEDHQFEGICFNTDTNELILAAEPDIVYTYPYLP